MHQLRRLLVLFFLASATFPLGFAVEAPKLVQKDGRWALLVDGRPYLILGGQIHNSSAWPSQLPQVWKSLAELHANTVEAPVYWEQMEAQPGQFNFANVDQLVKGAREHNLHLVLLWFGTWKNGNMHYVPEWVKTDTKRFPRVINANGEPIDVLSANSRANLEADKAAFVALMRHLKALDGDEHTVLAGPGRKRIRHHRQRARFFSGCERRICRTRSRRPAGSCPQGTRHLEPGFRFRSR